MVGGQQDVGPHRVDHLVRHLGPNLKVIDDGEVDLAPVQLVLQFPLVALDEVDGDVRVQFAESLKQAGESRGGERHEAAEREYAGEDGATRGGLLHLISDAQDVAGVPKELQPGWGEGDPSCLASHRQAGIEHVLEVGQCLGEAGLRHVQPQGRLGQRASLSDGDEVLQLAKGEVTATHKFRLLPSQNSCPFLQKKPAS